MVSFKWACQCVDDDHDKSYSLPLVSSKDERHASSKLPLTQLLPGAKQALSGAFH